MPTTTTDAPADRVAALVIELHDGIAALTTGEDWQRYLAVASRVLGDEGLDAAMAAGRALSLDEAVREALEDE